MPLFTYTQYTHMRVNHLLDDLNHCKGTSVWTPWSSCLASSVNYELASNRFMPCTFHTSSIEVSD